MTIPNPFRFVVAMVIAGYARVFGYAVLASEEVHEARQAICDPCEFRGDFVCRPVAVRPF